MYKNEDLIKIQDYLKKIFPEEENFIGKLSESILLLNARANELAKSEVKFIEISLKNHEEITNLPECQQEFFDKHIAFLQGLYSVISATILFIKNTRNIKKSMRTGRSTKQFLKSCYEQGIIKEATFQILNQSIIIRSLVSDHMQDGLLNWFTGDIRGAVFNKKINEDNRDKEKEIFPKFHLFLTPMIPFNKYSKQTRDFLQDLCWVSVPIRAIICPHFSDVMSGYSNLIYGLSNHKNSN